MHGLLLTCMRSSHGLLLTCMRILCKCVCLFVCVCVYFCISFVVSLYTAVCTQFSQTHRMHPAAAAVAAWVGVQVIHTYLDVILKVILGLARRTSQAGSVDLCWSAAMHQLAQSCDLSTFIRIQAQYMDHLAVPGFLYLACLAELACQVGFVFTNGITERTSVAVCCLFLPD